MSGRIRRLLGEAAGILGVWAGVLAGALGGAQGAAGGGFEIPSQGARATGQGDAFVAQADDPSAIHYNPAGLTQLRGTQLMTGLYTIFPEFDFRGPAGQAENDEIAYIPHFYAATDAGLDRWRFGLGVNTVFGLGEDWGKNSPLRVTVTNADLAVTNIAPTVACRLSQDLSLGVALNVYYGEVELNNQLPFPTPPAGSIRVEGSDFGLGATLGLLWTPHPRHSLGLVYRSPFQLDFDGESRIWRPGQPTLGPSDTRARVDFPQIIVIGYAFRPTPQLKIEVDVEWTDWETLDQVPLRSDDPRFSSLPARRFDYDASFAYRFGVQYQLTPTWALRAGYVFSESASPEQTFTPAVLDLDTHILTCGLGYTQPKWEVNLAYRYILGEDRDVDQSVNSPPGRYSDIGHAVMLSLTLKL